jgi:hypothetical protein
VKYYSRTLGRPVTRPVGEYLRLVRAGVHPDHAAVLATPAASQQRARGGW